MSAGTSDLKGSNVVLESEDINEGGCTVSTIDQPEQPHLALPSPDMDKNK